MNGSFEDPVTAPHRWCRFDGDGLWNEGMTLFFHAPKIALVSGSLIGIYEPPNMQANNAERPAAYAAGPVLRQRKGAGIFFRREGPSPQGFTRRLR